MGKTRNFNKDYYMGRAISHSGIAHQASREQQYIREEASRHHGKIDHLASPPLPPPDVNSFLEEPDG